jgi:hypothetical protein
MSDEWLDFTQWNVLFIRFKSENIIDINNLHEFPNFQSIFKAIHLKRKKY